MSSDIGAITIALVFFVMCWVLALVGWATKRCPFVVPWALLLASVVCVELLVIAVP